MTPEQIEALNRAIAEYDGWEIRDFADRKLLMVTYKGEPGEGFDYSGLSSGGIEKAMYHAMLYLPDYTRDLDVIVLVVQKWCEENTSRSLDDALHYVFNSAPMMCENYWVPAVTLLRHERPALALCLAFAKAAGLKWEKEGK